MSMDELRVWAERYYEWGWTLIPISRTVEKTPAVKWKRYQSKRASLKTLRQWIKDDRNLAVVFGDASQGLGARDYDDLDSYESWVKSYPLLARQLPSMRTKRGVQVFFRVNPAEVADFRDSSNKPGHGAITYHDGELRIGCGCYSVIPPAFIQVADDPAPDLSRFWDIEPESIDDFPYVRLADSGLYVPKNFPNVTESTDEYGGVLNEIRTGDSTDSGSRFEWGRIKEDEYIQEAIEKTLPTNEGQRHHCIFEFCRWLKAIPRFTDAPAKAPELEEILRLWHQRALPFIRTKDFDETVINFRSGWPRVRYLKGHEPMNEIMLRACKSNFPKTPRKYDSMTVKELLKICRELQRSRGDAPFYLSCRTAAKFLEVSPMQISRYFFLLVDDGILQKVGQHVQGSMKAQRYRYVLPVIE